MELSIFGNVITTKKELLIHNLLSVVCFFVNFYVGFRLLYEANTTDSATKRGYDR